MEELTSFFIHDIIDKDIENGQVSVRDRRDGDIGSMDVDSFIEKICEEVENKTIK